MNVLARISTPLIALILAAGCNGEMSGLSSPDKPAAPANEAPGDEASPVSFDLSSVFDCVRENDGLVIASHRGGPAPGYPENAIETLQYGFDAGIRVFEIDVAESRDGTLFLMHDRSLGRTTTGSGLVADTDWADLQKMKLVDDEGTVTDFSIPTLEEALSWARETGAILELDRKVTTSFRNIIHAVRDAGAENNVILITYNDDEALRVAEVAPELMIKAGIGDRDHEAAMIEAGLAPEKLIVWTGTNRPNPGKWRGLASKGIESAFGTLGRKGERLDDQYWADGDPSEYQDLLDGGLVMLDTDEPYRLLEVDGPVGQAVETANRTCLKASG